MKKTQGVQQTRAPIWNEANQLKGTCDNCGAQYEATVQGLLLKPEARRRAIGVWEMTCDHCACTLEMHHDDKAREAALAEFKSRQAHNSSSQ